MSNCNCAMALKWKPCPRSPFGCGRCYAKLRNAGRTWKLAIPTYAGGQIIGPTGTTPKSPGLGTERVLENDIFIENPGDPVTYIECRWTNYGQQIFDSRLFQSESYNGSDFAGGWLDFTNWPDWVTEIVPSGVELRSVSRSYVIPDLTYVDRTYDEAGDIDVDHHYRFTLSHNLVYTITGYHENGSTFNHEVTVVYPGAMVYRCFDVHLCPLAPGNYMRFEREIPLPTIEYSEALQEGTVEEINPLYSFPDHIDAYHVDIDPL